MSGSIAVPGRARMRRAWFGLLTVLGLSRRGFFIPHRYAARLPGPGERGGYPAAEARLAREEAQFLEVLLGLAPYQEALATIGDEPPPAPRWTQDWFPRLDATIAYSMVRRERPAQIVEVGSGHSTRFLARAVTDGAFACHISAIDPEPRASLSSLRVDLIPSAVPEVGDGPFRQLEAGDFLMIDSSHILMPGSDADFLFGRVVPRLPAGVFVHIHDIFLPDDYPEEWNWRGYNEQLAVLQMLLGTGWDIVFASHYVATRMAEAMSASAVGRLPLGAGAYESSLWLRKSKSHS